MSVRTDSFFLPTLGASKLEHHLRVLGTGLLLAAAYYFFGLLGLKTAVPPGLATAIWPASGIAVSVLLLKGEFLWPGILAGSLLLNFPIVERSLSYTSISMEALIALVIAVGSSLQACVAASFVRRFLDREKLFCRLSSVLQFTVLDGVCCTIAPTISVTTLVLSGVITQEQVANTWLTWWLGDFIGIQLVVPFFFAFKRRNTILWEGKKAIEFSVFAIVSVAFTLVTFWELPYRVPTILPYGLLFFVFWVSLRFSQFTSVTSTLFLILIATLGTVGGYGPFRNVGLNNSEALILLQTFVFIMICINLTLSSALIEKDLLLLELQRRNHDLNSFTSVVSHDLKAPLRTISNFMQLLRQASSGQLGKEELGYVDLAIRESQHLSGLIDSLQEYARLGWQEIKIQAIDTEVLVRRVLETLKPVIEQKGAIVEVDHLPRLSGETMLIELLFQNLISNAIKFHRPGVAPHIRIQSYSKLNEYVFSVADNGIGIPAASYNTVFEIFKRLHPRSSYPGSGIGLATCKKIVEAHGGKIWLESKEGEGTTIYFSLLSRTYRS